MPNRTPTKNASHYQRHKPIASFINSVQFRNNRVWHLREGQFFTNHNGREITAQEFDELHPIANPLKFNYSPENSDPRNQYLFK